MSHNSPNFREIEKKFLFKTSKQKLAKFITKLKEEAETPASWLTAETIDHYWEVPGKAQFMRLRHSWGIDGESERREIKELTVKQKDKGSNLNRLELNVQFDGLQLMRRALTLSLGQPIKALYKKDFVIWTADHTVISICSIKGGGWYLEVEGGSYGRVRYWSRFCARIASFKFVAEKRSLFEIYVKEST